jgi:PAT family beta-lactamase induction signal transducer AmpG
VAAAASPIVDRPRVEGEGQTRLDFARAVKEPVADLYSRTGAMFFPILALVALYRLPDFVAGVMSNPLYVDLGFSKAQIASVAKIYGVWIGIGGAFVGGFAVSRFGIYRTLLAGAAASAISHLLFAWLSDQGASLPALVVAISADNFSGSFCGTALIAYMSALTAAGFSATQYALLSSLYALPGKLVGGASGFIVAAYGYATFFALTAAVAVPVLLLVRWVAGNNPRRS